MGGTQTTGDGAFPQIPLHDLIGVPADTTAGYSSDHNVDIACGNVAAGGTELFARGAIPVTTDLHIRYFRQPNKGPLVVKAHSRRRGKRPISVECTISDGDARELISATATYMVIEGAFEPG